RQQLQQGAGPVVTDTVRRPRRKAEAVRFVVVLDGAVTHRPVGVIELGVEPVGGISRDRDGARVAVIGLAAELSVALEADEREQAVLPCPTGPPRVETAGMASDGGRRVRCGSSTEHLAAR